MLGPTARRTLRSMLRWLAALSLALDLVLVALWGARQLRPRPASGLRERARGDLFHALATAAVTHRDVVVVGDSLTERGEWWELLDRPVANRGVAGDTVAAVRARLDDIVALDPRVVVLGVGINDLLAGASPEALAAHHARLIGELRERLPRARIVVESLLPIRDALVARDAELTSATVRRANELCRRAAAAAGVDWLDLHARLADPHGELDPRYSSDGLHLSGAGYRAWAAALVPYLR
jgi:lysophospholipase L1-like esterase